MKKLLLLLIAAASFSFAFSQNDEGEIIYEMIIHINIDKSNLPPEALSFVEAMPKEMKDGKKLVFNSEASLYTNYEDPENAEVEMETDRMKIMMRRNLPNEHVYVDLEEKRIAEQKEFFGRVFLVRDDVKPYLWKMTGEQEEIAGYPCMVATAMDPDDSTEVIAWFTPSIPVPSGPSGASNLPGMILKMEAKGGGGMRRGPGGNSTIEIVAKTIEFRKVKKNELKEPEKGKEVTREEYQAIVKEKMEEMREQWKNGGGGGVRMMHH